MRWKIEKAGWRRRRGCITRESFPDPEAAARSLGRSLPYILLAGEGNARARALWPMRKRISAEFRRTLRSGFHTGLVYANGGERPPSGPWGYPRSEMRLAWVRIPRPKGAMILPEVRVHISVVREPPRNPKRQYLPPHIGSQAPWKEAMRHLLPELRERREARAIQRTAWASDIPLPDLSVDLIYPIPRAPGIAIANAWGKKGFGSYILTKSGKRFAVPRPYIEPGWRRWPATTERIIRFLQDVLGTKIPKEMWRTEALERLLTAAAMEGKLKIM